MRRLFSLLFLSLTISKLASAVDAGAAAEQAHNEIWRRFIDKHGVMVDFAGLDGTVNLPTPEECKEGKPNALGWYQPIENGAMFNGMYMDGAVSRWEKSHSEADATRARRLMEGLLFLNSISEVKGFVGRGVTTDGKSHYAMGSNDQTMPWYTGLWRYYSSGIATAEEKARIKARLVETTDVIMGLKWAMPAEEPFRKRGSFAGFAFDAAPRQLFVLKMMSAVTGDPKWETLYQKSLEERGGKDNASRREICEKGMVFEYARTHNWTSCTCVAGLRGLWELEQDPVLKALYAKGLTASANLAAESLADCAKFDHNDGTTFSLDWRQAMMPLWKPHSTEQEAQSLADIQLRAFMKLSPRRGKETAFVREPTAAAWIVTLCPDREIVSKHAEAIKKVLTSYNYADLYYCTFFWAESAWYRLP